MSMVKVESVSALDCVSRCPVRASISKIMAAQTEELSNLRAQWGYFMANGYVTEEQLQAWGAEWWALKESAEVNELANKVDGTS